MYNYNRMKIEDDFKEICKVCDFDEEKILLKNKTYDILKLMAIIKVLGKLGYSKKNMMRFFKLTEKRMNTYTGNFIIYKYIYDIIVHLLIERGTIRDYSIIGN